MNTMLEWSGSLLGLVGAFLLATNSRVSRYGWIAFLAANVFMICFAVAIHRIARRLYPGGCFSKNVHAARFARNTAPGIAGPPNGPGHAA